MSAAAQAAREVWGGRAFLWAWLARAFSYPRADRLSELAQAAPEAVAVAGTLGVEADADLPERAAAAGARLGELQGLHNRLFVVGLEVPPRETAYELDRTARRSAELADVGAFYRAFGLRIGAPLEPDHLVVELEFLSVLAQKIAHFAEAGAEGEEGRAVCEEAYRAFLDDHVGRWIAAFCARLEEMCEDPFLRAAGRLLLALTEAEIARLGLDPQRLSWHGPDAAAASSWPCGAGPGAAARPGSAT
ncbi:Chaperone protein TorD [bacterium HR39]|nr:Chaperone protein TorD [bacterium HR39]